MILWHHAFQALATEFQAEREGEREKAKKQMDKHMKADKETKTEMSVSSSIQCIQKLFRPLHFFTCCYVAAFC